MANGGRRPGAGRKKGSKAGHTIVAEKAREFVINEIAKNLRPLIKAKLDLALGHATTTIDIDGKPTMAYYVSPDGAAIQYLLNQGIGKPRETMEIVNPPAISPEDLKKANQALVIFLHGRRTDIKK